MKYSLRTLSVAAFAVMLIFPAFAQEKPKMPLPTISVKTMGMKAYPGYFNYYWEESEGKIWLEVDKWETEFLYVNGLTGGIGSNDIGLDRNQLGSDRIVKFIRSGPKVMLLQPNYSYRAVSDNPDERQSVEEAFARSIIGGFKVEAQEGDRVLIDLTPFLLRDAHDVAARLRNQNQGNYTLDANRSAIYLERTKNFPKNSEFEAWITFAGEAKGPWIQSVTPAPDAVTVRTHHSFIELPDNNYAPRAYDPRSGYIDLAYADYSTPISQPIKKRLILRHRLHKKDPSAAKSEPVEPIIYYVDRGAPEPIKSALIEGASWWNQAFEAAGYVNAFRVEELPVGADPMDVRYNMINWVHRSTRGWSYGSSVVDPRTGEIIKGHVLLGSLRVRQDFLLAQGLVDAYAEGKTPDPRLEAMALARLRQLSAHEVGHTIGLTHNFAASVNNRASVMDYPHPYVTLDAQGNMDFSQAYATGIGEWDKRAIIYGYQDFPKGTNEADALDAILKKNIEMGLLYLSDSDARPASGASPIAHLWDNGASAIEELERISNVRKTALSRFSEKQIPVGAPMGTLENVLVPVYLSHRYQVEAVSKMIGGVEYSYAARGDGQVLNKPVDPKTQRAALDALLKTLDPAFLELPQNIIRLIPPQPEGYQRDRELFKVNTGPTFDPLAAAESSAAHTLSFVLNPARLARLIEQRAMNPGALSVDEVINQLQKATKRNPDTSPMQQEIRRITEKLLLHQLLQLAGDSGIMQQVSAMAWKAIVEWESRIVMSVQSSTNPELKAHQSYLQEQIRLFRQDPSKYKVPAPKTMPDGQPIGCGE